MTPEQRLKQKNEFDGNVLLGVRKFNLMTGRDEHLEHRAQTKDQYLDPVTGLLQKDLSVSRPCPVCGADDEKLLFLKDGFRHLKCRDCGMVYVNPILKGDRLHSFYSNEESYAKVLTNELQLSVDRKRSDYGLDLIEELLPEKGRLLDVGCGPGTFLEAAKPRGWEVCGIEFNAWCVKRLKEKGVPVMDSPLEKADIPPHSLQCVTLWLVLEHIADPGEMLRNIHRILAPQGVLLIMVPNIDSLANRILHEKSGTFSGDSHVNFFNATTLSRLLAATGYEATDCETVLSEIGTIGNYLNYEDPFFGEARSPLEFLTPEYIHERMLGYCLLALSRARKG